MGLDMYLTCKLYVSEYFEKDAHAKLVEIFGDTYGNPMYVEFEVGYWRKANAIHQWFVDRCQHGIDDCRVTYVTTEDLQALLDACLRVKQQPEIAGELLPTQEGFFFGGTEYDEYYFKDIDATIEILNRAIELSETEDIYYHSSW